MTCNFQNRLRYNILYMFRNKCVSIHLHSRYMHLYNDQSKNYNMNNHIPLALFLLPATATESSPILLRQG